MINKKSVLVFSIFLVIIVSAFAILKLHKEKNVLKSQLPYLVKGETITYFDVIGTESNKVNAAKLNESYISLVFIFEQPCSHCDLNLAIWNRIANILKCNAAVFGIIPGEPAQMFELQEKARLNFKIFVPDDLPKFKEEMRIKTNMAQTILYVNKKVEFVKFGNLDGNDFTTIVRKAKEIINRIEKK